MKQRTSARSGFTLIELLVVIAIIAILAAILFPVFAKARERAKAAGCLSNLKQMGTAARMYVDDYNGKLVPYGTAILDASAPGGYVGARFTKLLEPYTKSLEIFTCPSDLLNRAKLREPGREYPTTYGVNWYICREAGSYWIAQGYDSDGVDERFVKDHAGTIWAVDCAAILPATINRPAAEWKENVQKAPIADIYYFYLPNDPMTGADISSGYWSTPNWASGGIIVRPFGRHLGRANAMFFDGHAASVPASQFDPNVTKWGTPECLWDNPRP